MCICPGMPLIWFRTTLPIPFLVYAVDSTMDEPFIYPPLSLKQQMDEFVKKSRTITFVWKAVQNSKNSVKNGV